MKGRDKRRRAKQRRVRGQEFGVRSAIENDDIQKLIDLPQKIARDAKENYQLQERGASFRLPKTPELLDELESAGVKFVKDYSNLKSAELSPENFRSGEKP